MSCGEPNAPASGQRPQLLFDESVGSDFQALAIETWDRFLTVFDARLGCFGDVRLTARRSLDSRAGYDPDTATVTVRVPGTPAMLQSALVHEWAHHVEFQCTEHQEFRRLFLVAHGLPPESLWWRAGTLVAAGTDIEEDSPSEQWAEATIEVVLGNRPIPNGVHVTEEMVRMVQAWTAGD